MDTRTQPATLSCLPETEVAEDTVRASYHSEENYNDMSLITLCMSSGKMSIRFSTWIDVYLDFINYEETGLEMSPEYVAALQIVFGNSVNTTWMASVEHSRAVESTQHSVEPAALPQRPRVKRRNRATQTEPVVTCDASSQTKRVVDPASMPRSKPTTAIPSTSSSLDVIPASYVGDPSPRQRSRRKSATNSAPAVGTPERVPALLNQELITAVNVLIRFILSLKECGQQPSSSFQR